MCRPAGSTPKAAKCHCRAHRWVRHRVAHSCSARPGRRPSAWCALPTTKGRPRRGGQRRRRSGAARRAHITSLWTVDRSAALGGTSQVLDDRARLPVTAPRAADRGPRVGSSTADMQPSHTGTLWRRGPTTPIGLLRHPGPQSDGCPIAALPGRGRGSSPLSYRDTWRESRKGAPSPQFGAKETVSATVLSGCPSERRTVPIAAIEGARRSLALRNNGALAASAQPGPNRRHCNTTRLAETG